jgi:hypothetical protein
MAAPRYGNAGEVIEALNKNSMSRNDPRLQLVKGCIDKVRAAAAG